MIMSFLYILWKKYLKTAARNYQWDILTNVTESQNQTCSKIDHGYSNRTLHQCIRPKLCNSGLKIMYPNLLVVNIGWQWYVYACFMSTTLTYLSLIVAVVTEKVIDLSVPCYRLLDVFLSLSLKYLEMGRSCSQIENFNCVRTDS